MGKGLKIGKPFKVKELLNRQNSLIVSGDQDTVLQSISTDTRTLEKGDFFLPIEGPSFDGHDFIADAIRLGCSGFSYSKFRSNKYDEAVKNIDKDLLGSLLVIRTGKTIDFLIDLASSYIGRFNTKNIGITGSVGKTTTKGFLVSILSDRNIKYTPKNYNTEIGVSLSALKIEQDTEFFIAELAMRGKEQIKTLSKMIGLDIGLITAIGPSHLEFFKDEKEIAMAKAEIACGFNKNAILFLNDGDKHSNFISEKVEYCTESFGSKKESYINFSDISTDDLGRYSFMINSMTRPLLHIDLKFPGLHNVYNACAAAAAAYALGVEEGSIKNGLENARIEGNRMNIERSGNMIILDDCYNANPLSVKEAINTLSLIKDKNPGRRAVAILADMLELGPSENELHFQVGQYLVKKGIDIAILFGRLSKNTCRGFKDKNTVKNNCHYFKDKGSLLSDLKDLVRDDDIILIKGSRSNRMETLLEILR